MTPQREREKQLSLSHPLLRVASRRLIQTLCVECACAGVEASQLPEALYFINNLFALSNSSMGGNVVLDKKLPFVVCV